MPKPLALQALSHTAPATIPVPVGRTTANNHKNLKLRGCRGKFGWIVGGLWRLMNQAMFWA